MTLLTPTRNLVLDRFRGLGVGTLVPGLWTDSEDSELEPWSRVPRTEICNTGKLEKNTSRASSQIEKTRQEV
jgi:hypothetical protein